ncbi:hypothetical protein V8E53_000715 [Lactarius tabidus]
MSQVDPSVASTTSLELEEAPTLDLWDYFSEFGKVDAFTIVWDADGKSHGFAFLTFEDPASVNAVVIREHPHYRKAIDPRHAIPREEHMRNMRSPYFCWRTALDCGFNAGVLFQLWKGC